MRWIKLDVGPVKKDEGRENEELWDEKGTGRVHQFVPCVCAIGRHGKWMGSRA